jgi:putative ABC transport system permease protein
MLRNYLKIAYRNLLKNKGFSLINIFGLAAGVAAFVLIFQYVQFETTYDTFQEEGERIYRVQANRYLDGQLESENAYTVPAFGPTIYNEIPGIANYFRLTPWAEKHTVVYDAEGPQRQFSFNEEKTIFADAPFVSFFSLDMLQAASDSLLTETQQLLLSESTAEKYFGPDWRNQNVLGKTLTVYNSNRDAAVSFNVQGVYADIPGNSHLDYELVFSHKSLPEFLPKEIPEEMRLGMFENMWGPNAWYTYVVLEENVAPAEIATKITDFVASRNEVPNSREEFILQPVRDIHLYSNLQNEPTPTGNARLVYAMGIIALFTLSIAWINYINLATARALERAREVGLRKVVGARKIQLVGQFMLEACILNLIALVLAITLVQVISPRFTEMSGISFSLFDASQSLIWWTILGILLIGTFFTGLYPAFVLSSFRPVSILKNQLKAPKKGIGLRKGLVIFQFAISLALIVGTIIIYGQIQFMREQDLGVNTEQTLVIEGPQVLEQQTQFGQTIDLLRNELQAYPSIQQVSASSHVPGMQEGLTRNMSRLGQEEEAFREVREIQTDHAYLPMMEVALLAGRQFSPNPEQNQQKLMLNKSAVEAMGFENTEAAIGAKVGTQNAGGVSEYEIIGVTENYHQGTLKFDYEPIAFFNEIYSGHYVIKFTPTQQASTAQTLRFVQQKWNQLLPDNPFNYFFLDSFFAQQYTTDQRFGQIFGTFSLLAILIACLGLFGLSSYTTAQRTKEIGIRKVLGASVGSIISLLSGDFVKLVLLSAVVALPLAYWAMNEWLQNYAFRIEISWWLLALPLIIVLLLALLTVSLQTVKAAFRNPAKSLRYE